jgi:DNA (cytosine-5)-methyltransferase 1
MEGGHDLPKPYFAKVKDGMAIQSRIDGGLRELALFAGAGGGILGGRLLGWRTVCAVEIDAYAASVLVARQNDGSLEPFPVWNDVRTFDGQPWRGRVDVISAGFPCQDVSIAGTGKGLDGERSGLWHESARLVCEIRPKFVFVENSPALAFRGLDVILRDLAQVGYNARWCVLGAVHAGAPHRRDRLWLVAHAYGARLQKQRRAESISSKHDSPERPNWWASEPQMDRMAHGLAHRVAQLKALGNGQVPAVAALAWETLTSRID